MFRAVDRLRVNVSPWDKTHPVWRLVLAVAIGSTLGMALLILIKGYGSVKGYAVAEIAASAHLRGDVLGAFCNGLFVSLLFLFKFREARAQTQMLRAEAERNLLSKQAVEAELKLMQAQVEPHFLFNTLASVQYLTETDPPQAGLLLGHLIAYLRAALPQLRCGSTTLGQEVELARRTQHPQMRMGRAWRSRSTFPPSCDASFPPKLLISLVENAIKHGIEPRPRAAKSHRGGRKTGSLEVTVTDTGRGSPSTSGQGVGLSNVRERLAALYGQRAQFTLTRSCRMAPMRRSRFRMRAMHR